MGPARRHDSTVGRERVLGEDHKVGVEVKSYFHS
jgi:hypothetical protein